MKPVVTITGGSGLVGQLLRPRLRAAGWQVDVYDLYSGGLVDLLRRRHLATSTSAPLVRAAVAANRIQMQVEQALLRRGAIRPGPDDILAGRERMVARFAGSRAVLHLAGFPHPLAAGATDADFVRLNYDASVTVFEAAREAGVATFVFASSAQVYQINSMRRIAQFPILESEPLPLPSEGQSTYGFLKGAFERYLEGRCTSGPTQAVSLRLEYPGWRSTTSSNHYVSTSLENLTAGVACALCPPDGLRFGAFNLCDEHVDRAVVDIQAYLAQRWPYVPNRTEGNASLLSTEKAQRELGYRPTRGGRYLAAKLVSEPRGAIAVAARLGRRPRRGTR